MRIRPNENAFEKVSKIWDKFQDKFELFKDDL